MRINEGIGGLLASTAVSLIAAYDSNGAGWKMDGDKIATDANGNPIYVGASGQEMSVEHGTIARLNGESKSHRERAEAAEASLKRFEGITDPDAARAALETVGKLDQSKLIDAGKVDEVKAEITRNYETRMSDLQKSLDASNQTIVDMRIDGAFASSEFIRDNLNIPIDIAKAAFKDRFKDQDGKITPINPDGTPMYSRKRAGEIADFDEAMLLIVDSHAQRDMLLKAPNASGTGSQGGGGSRGGSNIIKRSDFDAMQPHEKAEYARKAGAGEVVIRD